MKKRKFSREFKIEAVKLVAERGVAVARPGCWPLWMRAVRWTIWLCSGGEARCRASLVGR